MSLSTWNWSAAALHAGFALYATTLSNKRVNLFKFEYDVADDPASDLDYDLKVTKNEGEGVSIRTLVVTFFALTSLAHVAYATDFFGRGGYYSSVFGFGWNPMRWIEYSITAAIMIYIISIVAGAKEQSTALVATLIVPGLMLQGLTVERELKQNALAKWSSGQSSKKPDIDAVLVVANFVPAWFFFGIKWYIIWSAYLKLRSDLKDASKTIDPKITDLVLIQFIAFSLFGIVQSIQVYGWTASRGNWSSRQSYETFEKMYISLSFLAKAALGISVARLLS
jgi:hypothetical protein